VTGSAGLVGDSNRIGRPRMRLLFVHEVNWQRKVVYEIHDYPELLSLRGHECVFIDFPEGEQPPGLRRILDLRIRVTRNLARAHRGAAVEVRTPGRVCLPPLDRLLASATQVPALRDALRDGRFDAMVLYAVPTNGWQALALAKRYRVPVLFRAIDVSHALRRTAYGPLIRWAERYIYRNVDWVSCNNEALREYVLQHGVHADRVSVDYPGLDLDRFAPGERPAHLCQRYGILPQHRTVMFMGTLYRFAGLDWFLEAFASVLRNQPNIRMLVFGGGEYQRELHATCRRLGIPESVIAPGFIGYSELADHIRLADVAINPFRPSLVTHCALPGKMLQYLGCGVPSVCCPLRGMMGMVPDGEGVLYREPGAPFVEAVKQLLANMDLRTKASQLARARMESACNWGAALDRIEDAIGSAIAAEMADRGSGSAR
jgi:glycosyltransferase involved in cell wall biosynthesis